VTNLFRFQEMQTRVQDAGDGLHDLLYEEIDCSGVIDDNPHRRIIEHLRTVYRKNDLSGLLPLGEMDSMALPGETYKLAFTPGLLNVYQRKRSGQDPENLLPDPTAVLDSRAADGGGYVDLDGNGHWWIPSGQVFYWRNTAYDPVQELDFARKHFFLTHRFCDPFGNNTVVAYDSSETDPQRNYSLLLTETCDPLDNTVLAQNNNRVLQPKLITDPNGAVSEALFDALGMVVATAVHKGCIGDSLRNIQADLTQKQVDGFFADPRGQGVSRLGTATTCIVYDVDRYYRTSNPDMPPYAATVARETHVSELRPKPAIENPTNTTNATVEVPDADAIRFKVGDIVTYCGVDADALHSDTMTVFSVDAAGSGGAGKTLITLSGVWTTPPVADDLLVIANPVPSDEQKVQVSFSYSDGFGREIQKKIQAEPEPVNDVHTDPRWVGSGWTIFNNKGKPVRQYEPFFDDSHDFRFGKEVGVSPILFYDPVERVVATLHPNNTYEKVVFDPWHQKTWDVNDTVAFDPRTDTDISGYVGEYFEQIAPEPDTWETWLQQRPEQKAAVRTLPHADTPTVAYLDSLGRTFLTVANNGKDANGNNVFYNTSIVLDIEGNQREVIDAKDRIVMQYDYDMLGNRIHQASMEAGERWMLNDVMGKPVLILPMTVRSRAVSPACCRTSVTPTTLSAISPVSAMMHSNPFISRDR
jgi:hypothetical protein